MKNKGVSKLDNKLSYISDVNVFDRSIYESTKPSNGSILRVLKGPIAEWSKLNRNKRMYSEKLWDKVLESPYVKEQLRFHTLYGEANHPESRYEVDFERVSHSIVEMWKVPASNQIWGTIHILDTPFGRILNTLYEAGGIIGYSTRAGGLLNKRKDYIEVDENSYNFITLDAVPYPSVESARPESVNEGVVTKVAVSEECHDSLFKIINESSEKEKEMIKDLIYSLQSFDLSKEIALLEGKAVIADETENDSATSVNETTKFLLKESAVQIETLKAENATLRATNETVARENKNLKSNLDSSLRKISNLMESAKVTTQQDTVRRDSKVEELSNTIRNLEHRVESLVSEALEREEELDSLRDAYGAYRILKDENIGLRSQLSHTDESTIHMKESQLENQRELEEAYEEVAGMVKELNQLQESYGEKCTEYDSLLEQVSSLELELSALRGELQKVQTITESSKLSESQLSSLREENENLRIEITDISEGMRSKDNYITTLKRDLVSLISSNYGLTLESVMSKLPVGFTKADIYSVCESLHNKARTNSVSVVSVVQESSNSTRKEAGSNKSMIGRAFVSNRRGVGII